MACGQALLDVTGVCCHSTLDDSLPDRRQEEICCVAARVAVFVRFIMLCLARCSMTVAWQSI